MEKSIQIILTGVPISTNSAYRHTCVGGFARSYMKKEAVALKESYQWQNKSQWKGKKPLEGSLELDIKVYLPTKRNTDWDNLHKLSMDSMNGIIFVDDKQIQKATVSKHYDKNNPRIIIIIKPI